MNQLIDASSHSWIKDLVQQRLPVQVANEILHITIGIANRDDWWYWHLDPKGTFSVRSAYKAAYNFRFYEEVADQSAHKAWQKIWHLNLMPKVLCFDWRACHEWLPTRQALTDRGMEVEGCCPMCNIGIETLTHLFCKCPLSTSIWSCSSIPMVPLQEG